MGADIHMMAEKRSRYTDESKEWQPVLAAIFESSYYRDGEQLSDWNAPYTFQPYEDRNYRLFSVLANVRNGDGLTPIAEPRGLPQDIHKFTDWYLEDVDPIDHSATWLTLEEVMAYPWTEIESDWPGHKTLADDCAQFLGNMKNLQAYAKSENCDIRLVFGFDS